MNELKPEEQDKVLKWLYEKGVQKCPVCSSADIYNNYKGELPIAYLSSLNLNAIQFICPNCFYVMMFCLPSIQGAMNFEQLVNNDI